ncbi:MAG: hypothetical protein AAF481_01910 [Acidobacteriota bacterium]
MSRLKLFTAVLAAALLAAGIVSMGAAAPPDGDGTGGTPPGTPSDSAREIATVAASLPRDALLLGPIPGLTTAWHLAPKVTGVPRGSTLRFLRAAHPSVSIAWQGAREVYRDSRWSMAEVAFEEVGTYRVVVGYELPNGQVLEDGTELQVLDVAPRSVQVRPLRAEAARSEGRSLRPVSTERWLASTSTPVRLVASAEPAAFDPLIEWVVDGKARLELGPVLELRNPRPGAVKVQVGPSGKARQGIIERYSVAIKGDPANDTSDKKIFYAKTTPTGHEDSVGWKVSGSPAYPSTGRGSTFAFKLDHREAPYRLWADDKEYVPPREPVAVEEGFLSTATIEVTLDPNDPSCSSGVILKLAADGLPPAIVERPAPPYKVGDVVSTEMKQLELGAFDSSFGHVMASLRPDRPSTGWIEVEGVKNGQFVAGSSTFEMFVEVALPDLGFTFDTGDESISMSSGFITDLPPYGTAYQPTTGQPVPLYSKGSEDDGEERQQVGWLCHSEHIPTTPEPPYPPDTPDEDWFESTGQTTVAISPVLLQALRGPWAGALDPVEPSDFVPVQVDLTSDGLQPAEVFLDPAPYEAGQIIHTEMARLELGGQIDGLGTVILRERQDRLSRGQILVHEVDADGNLIAGEASFDIFFDLELPELGMTFHTGMESVHVTAGTITGLPPIGAPYEHDEDDVQDIFFFGYGGSFDPAGELYAGNHWPTREVPCSRCAVDLDIDSDNNNGVGLPDRSAFEDSIEENSPGKYIALNDDDDNGDNLKDLTVEPILRNPPEDDPVWMVMELSPNTPPDQWTLTYPAQVQVYDMDANPPAIIPSGVTFPAPLVPNPKNVAVEGVQVSAALGDVAMTLTYECTYEKDGYAFTEVLQDTVKATVIKVDLDVDSDNNRTTADYGPHRTDAEDNIEDQNNQDGRFVPVNGDDDDNDRVIDWADGWNRDTIMSLDDVNPQENDDVKMVLEIPAPVDLTVATLRFTYSASDPAAMPAAPNPANLAPAPGNLRIWNKKGNPARRKERVNNNGNYIHTLEVYKATDLGLGSSNRSVDLWLEGIRPSVGNPDRILVEVDPDGPGPAGWVAKDAVRVTVFGIEILGPAGGAGAGAATDHVQVGRWETSFQGTAANPAVRNNFEDLEAERYYVEVTDRAGGAGPIAADKESFERNINPNGGAALDQVNNLSLTAGAANTYRSGAFVLVVNDDDIDDDFVQAPDVDGTDDGADDVTMFGRTDGKVMATYTKAGATTGSIVDVCDKKPTDETKRHDVRFHRLRVTPGGAAVGGATIVADGLRSMNDGWAQCCIQFDQVHSQTVDPPAAEAFNDTGFDHDGNAATPNIGAGNGTFDFVDADNDNLHDNGERSETFTDANGNNGYDFGVNLADGMNEFGGNLIPTREERHLIDTFSDGNSATFEYIIVNFLNNGSGSGSRGENFRAGNLPMLNNLTDINILIVSQNVPSAGFVTAPHEAGHILLADGSHTNRLILAGRINLMKGGGTDANDAVGHSKRFTNAQCTTARGF